MVANRSGQSGSGRKVGGASSSQGLPAPLKPKVEKKMVDIKPPAPKPNNKTAPKMPAQRRDKVSR